MSAPDDRERQPESAREGGADRAAGDAEPVAGSEWVPAFEGQRPPFQKGHTLSTTHGARSPRKIEEIARRVSDELLERFPVVAEYPETLTALARSESVTRLLFADIVQKGVYDAKGDFRASIISRYFTAENSSAKLRASLGMTPQSEAQVARDRAAATASAVDVVGELIRQGQATRSEQPALPSAHDDSGAAAREEHGHD